MADDTPNDRQRRLYAAGVKLEEQVLITESGAVPLGLTPYQETWP